MYTNAPTSRAVSLHFKHLPLYADFIKRNLLTEFVTEQVRISREVNLPILKYLDRLSEEELFAFSRTVSAEFLGYLAANDAESQIFDGLEKWRNNQLPLFEREELVADDIILVNHVRKQAFLRYVTSYTTDPFIIVEIVKEIDCFTVATETAAFKAYVQMIGERSNEQNELTEKINSTSPGVIYVYDLQRGKMVFSNWKMKGMLGYNKEELTAIDKPFAESIQHPDDVRVIQDNLRDFNTAEDGEIRTIRHRMKAKDGAYKWMRNYESVFKRDADGRPTQIIGISLDIDEEKQTSEKLVEREEQLLQAQELAEIGSFVWNLETMEGAMTPQLLKILELDNSNDLNYFAQQIHPDDQQRVRQVTGYAIEQKGIYEYECRYMAKSGEKIIWAKGNVMVVNGSLTVKGTIMDVSERHKMMQRLQESDELFKEAQALTHIGNWTWDIEKNVVTWSEELYRIYNLEPFSETITLQKFIAFIHPNDREYRLQLLTESIQTLQQTDYLFRIKTRDNNVKILHGKSEVRADKNGLAVKLIGTCQDVTEKQLLLERLQQSERLYKQAQALSHIGNWTYDFGDKGTIAWSDEMFRIYGLDIEKRSMTYEELFIYNHPADAEMVAAEMKKSVEQNLPHDFYFRIILNDGTVKTIHARGENVLDENGSPYRMIGTAQDVTKQKQIERELQDNRNFIQKIADATPSIITTYNIHNGKYGFVSEGLKKLLGFEQAELLNSGFEFMLPLMHPDDMAATMKKNEQALALANAPDHAPGSEIVTEFLYRVLNKEGDYRWLRTYGTVFDRNNKGQVENILNISLDVTDHIEAEKRLLEQEHFIKHIAEASPTILYLYSIDERRFLYINKEVKEVLGYEPEEVIEMGDKASLMYLHPEDAIKSPDKFVKYLTSSGNASMRQFEGRVKDKNRKWKWMLTREIVFKRDANGQALEVLGSALDITDRKEMEQTLVYKTIQLQQSNASLEEFAHVASHDLQEPLRKISTFGDRLLSTHKNILTADGQVYLDKIVQSAIRMQQLINDILSVSLISGQKSTEHYSLAKLLDEVLQTLEYKIEDRAASIIADALPEANIIPSQFRQLLQNLLSNSIKFARPGMQPEIKITHEFVPYAAVAKNRLQMASQYLRINIADNGIGFEDIFSEKIFSIFQRLNSRAEYEGTGIGLAICKKIVENHGGIITASGCPNEGAEFNIIIPA